VRGENGPVLDDAASAPVTELLPGRDVPLGGVRGMSVTRWLPHRALPMVGAWCFLDRIGPQRVDMRVQPHPHTGLQTVTWPLAGRIRHRDSLGTDVELRPGELNLMTSGRGVAHSEHSLGEQPLMHALQLWVALPAGLDGGPARFEQHRDLPLVERPGLRATVVVGALDGATSPARVHTPLVGADVVVEPGTRTSLPLHEGFEHAVLVLDGTVTVAGTALDGGPLLHLGQGRSRLDVTSATGARLLLLGGEPYREDLVMWWNFIGRTHEDVVAARADWEADGQTRFGVVPGHGGERIPAPPLPPVRLTPRRRRPPLPGAPGQEASHEVEPGAPAPAMS
jgi:quercetin 2,3-dioxygenase